MEKVTISDKVSALVTEILVNNGITWEEFRNGEITEDMRRAALEMSRGSILLDRSFLQSYAGIPSKRMHNILRHAD